MKSLVDYIAESYVDDLKGNYNEQQYMASHLLDGCKYVPFMDIVTTGKSGRKGKTKRSWVNWILPTIDKLKDAFDPNTKVIYGNSIPHFEHTHLAKLNIDGDKVTITGNAYKGSGGWNIIVPEESDRVEYQFECTFNIYDVKAVLSK